MKKLILGSVVAAALVFTGCGSDDDTPPAATTDTTAPVFTSTAATLAMNTGSTVPVAATDASNPIVYALTEGTTSGFSLSGSTLRAPDTAVEANVTITATDSAATPNTATRTILVTVTVPPARTLTFDAVEDNRTTWAVADDACTAAGKRLATISELEENNATIFNGIDFNSTVGTAGFSSVIWSSTTDDVNTSRKVGLWYKNGTSASAVQQPAAPGESYYHLCVEAQ